MLALLFPGQGAQDANMADAVRHAPEFDARYEAVCDHAGVDILKAVAAGDRALLDRNLCSSLMTAFVSSLSLDLYLQRSRAIPDHVAGYSVGQWTALYAAGALDYETLIEVIATRARLMDDCMDRQPGAMCAVIGLRLDVIQGVLAECRALELPIFVSNYNCVGQYSIAGSAQAIGFVETRLAAQKPKKLLRLRVSGAWHCPLLQEASEAFHEVLQGVQFRPPRFAVVDNVTGGWLPTDVAELRITLARHLSSPVLWESCIQTLIREGVRRCVEIGYGNTLTKFGFFIDRGAEFSAFHG